MNALNVTLKNILTLALLCLFVWGSSAIAAPELSSMRIGQTEDKTRVVFDMDSLGKYRVSTLSNPSRIVVDFYRTDNDLSFSKKHITDKRLYRIRVSDSPKRVRVVLDLHGSTGHKVFALSNKGSSKSRLVLDLTDNVSIAKTVAKRSPKKVTPVKTVKPKVALKVPVKKATPLVKMSRVKHRSGDKAKAATQYLLNKDSLVFAQHEGLVVAIDAGHGGKDVGAIGHNRLHEKDVTLKMARELKRLIDRQPGMRAILTRKTDVFIPLGERIKIAKSHNADMFISVHADAFHDRSVKGGSVYVLSRGGASSVMARLLAKSENASLQDIKLQGRDEDVAFALSDLTREANIRASHKLADTVLHEMLKKVKMHKHSVQSAGFAVLKSIDMPSLLIETAFISNPHEARNLMSSKFQNKMASAIVAGLTKFVARNAQKPRWGESLYVHYKVQSGDTLSQIAENYQVSTQVLKRINHIQNPNQLYVGRRVKIPLSEKLVAGL